jgi:DNA-binding CsgD family transcriptional regulator/tetratricopeptide (TPR) repeat protein
LKVPVLAGPPGPAGSPRPACPGGGPALTGVFRTAQSGDVAWSAPLVGRSDDLHRLADVLGGRSTERTALLLGDAGIGKSRLLSEVTQHLSNVTVLQGGCLPLTEALPLLPIVVALRDLAGREDGGLFTDALSAQPAYVRPEIARLLPELGETAEDVNREPGEEWRRERLFSAVRALFVALAARRPVALVVEDLHWADRTTLDLLRFLVASGSGSPSPVPLAVSCRIDELSVNTATVDWLAAIRAVPGVVEVSLGPLAPAAAAEQVQSLLGHRPTSGTLEALYRRTGGNPFFTEQLIAADLSASEEGATRMTETMPPGLASLLRARVRRVSEVARLVLSALAVADRPVSEGTVAAVTGLEPSVVEDALIELIESRLVTSEPTTNVGNGLHRPRHQLLAEVVTADLLPVRRSALHARFADILAATGDAAIAAEVAAHWRAAGRPAEELSWTAAAGEAAEEIYAFAEAALHWERVTQLWDDVDERPTGLRIAQAYLDAIEDLHACGDMERASVLTEEALDRVGDGSDPHERAILLIRASNVRMVSSLESAVLAAEEAVRLFSALPPSHERSSAFGTYGLLLDVVGRPDDAVQAMSQGLEAARAAGSRDDEAGSLTDLAQHELFGGDWNRGLAYLAKASELAEESTDVETLALVAVIVTDTLVRSGQLRQAIASGHRALERIRALGGAARADAAVLASNVVEAMLELGDFAAAGEMVDPLTSGSPSRAARAAHQLRARLDMIRGQLDEAAHRLAAVRAVVPANPSILLDIEQDDVEIALWQRRPESAVSRLVDFLPRIAETNDSRDAGRLLASGMRAYADMAESARARGDEMALRTALNGGEQLVAQYRSLRHDPLADHPAVSTAAAQRATWHAEHARLSDDDQAELWQVAADEWYARERPHRRAYALWRQAEALLATGRSAPATQVLVLAATLATEFVPLHERIAALARRARVDLGPAQPQPASSDELPYGLTERELAVLRLLALGRTNAQIGAALFMSPKTASVHVTHILRKLGVTGRLQAATLAERAGIVDAGDDAGR